MMRFFNNLCRDTTPLEEKISRNLKKSMKSLIGEFDYVTSHHVKAITYKNTIIGLSYEKLADLIQVNLRDNVKPAIKKLKSAIAFYNDNISQVDSTKTDKKYFVELLEQCDKLAIPAFEGILLKARDTMFQFLKDKGYSYFKNDDLRNEHAAQLKDYICNMTADLEKTISDFEKELRNNLKSYEPPPIPTLEDKGSFPSSRASFSIEDPNTPSSRPK